MTKLEELEKVASRVVVLAEKGCEGSGETDEAMFDYYKATNPEDVLVLIKIAKAAKEFSKTLTPYIVNNDASVDFNKVTEEFKNMAKSLMELEE